MSTATKKGMDEYFAEAKSFDQNKRQSESRSLKLAWKITSASVLLTLLSWAALAGLTPLKQIEPIIVRVNNTTGAVDVSKVRPDEIVQSEVMDAYFLKWYVTYRETYQYDQAKINHRNVGWMSAPREKTRFNEYMQPDNANSPLNTLGKNGEIRIQIKSLSFLGNGIAQVRYKKLIEVGSTKQESHWAATINYQYVGSPPDEEARYINPLGIQITSYRNDPDGQTTDVITPGFVQPAPAIETPGNGLDRAQSSTVVVPAISTLGGNQ